MDAIKRAVVESRRVRAALQTMPPSAAESSAVRQLRERLEAVWPSRLAVQSRQSLRVVHASWAEAEARIEAARGALSASKICESLALQGQMVGSTMLPGPACQAIAHALMTFDLWDPPVTQPRVNENW